MGADTEISCVSHGPPLALWGHIFTMPEPILVVSTNGHCLYGNPFLVLYSLDLGTNVTHDYSSYSFHCLETFVLHCFNPYPFLCSHRVVIVSIVCPLFYCVAIMILHASLLQCLEMCIHVFLQLYSFIVFKLKYILGEFHTCVQGNKSYPLPIFSS